MIDIALAFAGLPKGLRDELLTSYGEITRNFLERRWEPSELNGGKFAEIVYSIVRGAVTGKFPHKATKPKNMSDACRQLEAEPADTSRVGDRSLRVYIPRALIVLYDIRNNRGVGHVGGDVNANSMDATVVVAISSWIMAELVRIFHGVTPEAAQETVDALVERKSPLIWEVEGVKRVLDADMPPKDQVLVFLHHTAGWVSATDLCSWVEYSTVRNLRARVLLPLHDARLIEFDRAGDRAKLSPKGVDDCESRLLSK